MKDKYNKSRDRFVRIITGFIAVFLILYGAVFIMAGKPVYHNYFHDPVFAPIPIIAGAILLYAVIFRWGLFRNTQMYNNKKRHEEEEKNNLSKKHKH